MKSLADTSSLLQITEMKDICDDPSEEDDDYPSPGSNSAASAIHQGFVFSYCSTSGSLRTLHPSPKYLWVYWDLYKENVDPIARIFHRPTFEKTVIEAFRDLDHISKPTEAVLFSIYLAVITSLSVDECQNLLSEDKDAAVRKYRFGSEQALARAEFLTTQEFTVLQALVLFLTCVRRHDDSRFVWTLTSVAIRLAQSMGIHRDGEQFSLSPFDTEMRRRLWWQICALDHRTSEDQGTDASITTHMFDTKIPLNVNDVDITPDMQKPPMERVGFTEMTFDLIRYTVARTYRLISQAAPGSGPCRVAVQNVTLEEKERAIQELRQELETKYLKYCDMKIPLNWVTATVTRLVMAKMWLIIHHPFQREDAGAGLAQDIKDRLFLTSIEAIQYTRLLETEKATSKWGWLFRTYVQWHAVAYVLSELCVRKQGQEVEAAWQVIEGAFEEWGGLVASNKKGMLWKPIRKLMAKARAVRAQELAARRAVNCPLGFTQKPTSMASINVGSMGTPVDYSAFDPATQLTNQQAATMSLPMGLWPETGQVQSNERNLDQWLLSDANIPQDLVNADDTMNWAGWNDMVNDYTLDEYGQSQNEGKAPIHGYEAGWW